MTARAWIAASLVALVAGGCAATSSPPPRPSAVAVAQATHEYPSSTPAPPQRAAGANGVTAVTAVTEFASAYINWSADTVSTEMRALAARSIGQARSAAELAAAETAGDYELQRGGIANTGVVEAVAPVRGHAGEYIVVTRELTTATATTAYQGLRPAWHVAIATATLVGPGQWVVSGWQPQS